MREKDVTKQRTLGKATTVVFRDAEKNGGKRLEGPSQRYFMKVTAGVECDSIDVLDSGVVIHGLKDVRKQRIAPRFVYQTDVDVVHLEDGTQSGLKGE